jgi:hypothetical protein
MMTVTEPQLNQVSYARAPGIPATRTRCWGA